MSSPMTPVSTPAAQTRNAWTCPTCRHGSPDPRDELAHLDAHRQLGQFFQEWDAAVASDRGRRRATKPLGVVLAALVAAVALVAGAVFWGLIDRSDTARPAPRPPAEVTVDSPSLAAPVPPAPAPVPQPVPATPEPAAAVEPPPPEAPAPAASPNQASRRGAAPAVGSPAGPVAAAAGAGSPVDEPVAPEATQPAPAAPVPAASTPSIQPPRHLIELTVLGIHLGIA